MSLLGSSTLRRVITALSLVLCAGCGGAGSADPIALGGGSVTHARDAACPASHPVARVVGDETLCLDVAVDLGSVTRADCAAADLDCDALYGCVPTALAQCDATTTTADCGGDGPPVLGCQDSIGGECRWFTSGCVATGFVASDCPSSDVCCLPGSSQGVAAFADRLNLGMVSEEFVGSYGKNPIALDDAFVLDVASGEPAGWSGVDVTCPASGGGVFFCDPNASMGATLHAGGADGRWKVVAQSIGASGFDLETRVTAGGQLRGRVCAFSRDDFVTGTCPPLAPSAPNCATTGTITVGTTGARAEVQFGSASWVIDFVP